MTLEDILAESNRKDDLIKHLCDLIERAAELLRDPYGRDFYKKRKDWLKDAGMEEK